MEYYKAQKKEIGVYMCWFVQWKSCDITVSNLGQCMQNTYKSHEMSFICINQLQSVYDVNQQSLRTLIGVEI